MATVATNGMIDGISGSVGKSLVFRTIRGKTFLNARARKPDKKKESEAQRNTRVSFSEASKWAQRILLNPEQKVYYQKRAKALKLPNAYTAAMTDYMRKPKVEKTHYGNTITYSVRKPGFTLNQVRIDNDEATGIPIANVVVHHDKDRWYVRYTTHDGIFSPLTLIITDHTLREVQYVDVSI